MHNGWLERYRHIIVLGLTIVSLVGVTIFYGQQPTTVAIEIIPTSTPSPTDTPTPIPTPSPVRVYITGAVVNPDVYSLPYGSIMKDVILAAGGLTEDAADLKMFNQALELQDQQHIHIPHVEELDSPPVVQDGVDITSQTPTASANQLSERININTATLAELDTLPRIGPAIGQNIIDYREHHGPFETIEEIMQVSGIGTATFTKLKEQITVE